MNDSTFPRDSSVEPPCVEDPPRDEVPRFGAVDIVEAFTAMRHEWRGQTKESRALGEQIQAAVANLQSLESKLFARAADNSANDSTDVRQLVLLIVETDHQLSRAVAAIAQWEMTRRLREQADAEATQQFFAGMSGVARWFARPLLTFIAEQRPVQRLPTENPAIEGLNLVMAKLRRLMNEQNIERLDTEGEAFDANTMYAIGAIASADCPSGHVLEQLSPAYRWQGRVLRFADVRVAK